MGADIEKISINKFMALVATNNASIIVDVKTLTLIKDQATLIECCLILSLTLELYQHIATESLFNLNSATLKVSSKPDFQSTSTIQLEISLKPHSLKHLQGKALTAEEAVIHLFTLNEVQPTHPLFLAENWLALSIKQQQQTGEVGYETLWTKIRPQALVQAVESGSTEEISEAVTDFFQAWTESNLSHLSDVIQKATLQPFGGFTQFFDELADVAVDAVAKAVTESDSLLEDVIAFLKNDNWPFEQIPDQSALRLAYRGQNGQWNCYTNIDETQRTIAFYSICPIATPEDRRSAVAEFITRANYGMVIGNFELDYSDGEIRYKTSIDVEGSVLNLYLIKQLVYTNVLTMDQYFPGILAVLEEGVEPMVAVKRVE